MIALAIGLLYHFFPGGKEQLEAGARRFVQAGLTDAEARELTIAMLAALEGAFVLARALRTTELLQVAGEVSAAAVREALERTVPRDSAAPSAAPVRPRLRARWPDRGERRSPGPA